ncbi:Clp protease N-terminal domain-containing protein [Streptomyces bottropensis]|uniref:Clp protease N-terminal domain-containing protein n=1 Tax=Streptomyces bottropensis TaxID=42235 RepID=UPI003A952D08
MGGVLPRISQQSAAGHGPDHLEIEGGLTDELASVVAGARRRALRDDDRQIDTAHLLHSLVESDPEVRAVFDGPQVARLLGYLVQRSIGYGLRWQIGVEDTGVVPGVPGRPGWSPVAARTMTQAHDRAVLRGAGTARGVDLLAVLVAATGSRAVEVLGKVGVDRDVVARRIAEVGEGCVEGPVVSGDGGC